MGHVGQTASPKATSWHPKGPQGTPRVSKHPQHSVALAPLVTGTPSPSAARGCARAKKLLWGHGMKQITRSHGMGSHKVPAETHVPRQGHPVRVPCALRCCKVPEAPTGAMGRDGGTRRDLGQGCSQGGGMRKGRVKPQQRPGSLL